MGLSIEIRKFINSKNTGEFVDVTLPGELPAKRAEVRSAQRDSAAVEDAKRRVKELASAKLTADKTLRAAQETLRKTRTEFDRCSAEYAQLEEQQRRLQPDFDAKKAAYENAKRYSQQKKSELDKANAELREAEEARHRAEQILRAATAASEAPDEKQKQELEASLKAASDRYDLKRTVLEAAKAVADAADEEYRGCKAEFDEVNAAMTKLSGSMRSAASVKNTLSSKLEKLTAREAGAAKRLENLTAEHRSAEQEVLECEGRVRPIAARYETARFHYIESGKGEPLILVHSAGQSLYTFNKLISKLSLKYRVIALDLAGHGYSELPNYFDYSIADHAESLARFMDAMGIETAHFLGFSMGADFVLMLASLHPERVDKVIAIAPGGVTAAMPFSIRLLESGIFGPLAGSVFSRKNVGKLINECTFDHTILKEHDVDQYANPFQNPDVRYGVRRTVNAFDEDDALEVLRSVEAETLLLWGDEDKWHPLDMCDEYLAALPNVKFQLVRNSGHLPHEERSDRVCELVFDFIPAGYDIED